MNKLLPITIFSLLFTIGCENFFGDRNDFGDPYANDMLLYDLEQDLALSTKQISDSKGFLQNGRDFFPDNASLWKLALYLQQNLTEEQKERLLSPPEYLIAEEISEENDYHHKRLRHHHRMDEFIRSILNEDQLSDYDEMVAYKKNALDEVFNNLKSGTQTKQEARQKMMGIMEWFRAAMDKLLTDDQKLLIEEMHKQKDDHWRKSRGGYGKQAKNHEKMKQEMYDVLGMSTEQISTLESIEVSFKSSLELLHDNFVDGVLIIPQKNTYRMLEISPIHFMKIKLQFLIQFN